MWVPMIGRWLDQHDQHQERGGGGTVDVGGHDEQVGRGRPGQGEHGAAKCAHRDERVEHWRLAGRPGEPELVAQQARDPSLSGPGEHGDGERGADRFDRVTSNRQPVSSGIPGPTGPVTAPAPSPPTGQCALDILRGMRSDTLAGISTWMTSRTRPLSGGCHHRRPGPKALNAASDPFGTPVPCW